MPQAATTTTKTSTRPTQTAAREFQTPRRGGAIRSRGALTLLTSEHVPAYSPFEAVEDDVDSDRQQRDEHDQPVHGGNPVLVVVETDAVAQPAGREEELHRDRRDERVDESEPHAGDGER